MNSTDVVGASYSTSALEDSLIIGYSYQKVIGKVTGFYTSDIQVVDYYYEIISSAPDEDDTIVVPPPTTPAFEKAGAKLIINFGTLSQTLPTF